MSSPYEIDLGPQQPSLPGSVVLRESLDDLLDSVCADINLQAAGCVREFGDFQFLISPTPQAERVLTRMMIDPNYREFPWSRTRVWVADDDSEPGPDGMSEGNRSLAELLLGHAGLPAEQLHGFHVEHEEGAQEPENRYQRVLRETLGWREKGQDRPDYALLTLGPDGGIAGMTQEDLEGENPDRLAVRSESGRLTVTLALLNAIRFVGVLGVGVDREECLRLIAEPDSRGRSPAAGLGPIGGELRWYVDHAACGTATEESR